MKKSRKPQQQKYARWGIKTSEIDQMLFENYGVIRSEEPAMAA